MWTVLSILHLHVVLNFHYIFKNRTVIRLNRGVWWQFKWAESALTGNFVFKSCKNQQW